ncbi:hypothetical protein LINPERHAP1_LOCUS36200 [Linum perenne]
MGLWGGNSGLPGRWFEEPGPGPGYGPGHLLLLSNLNLHSLLPKLSSSRLPTAIADRRLPRVGKSWSFVGGLFIQALRTLSHGNVGSMFFGEFKNIRNLSS